MLAAYFDDSGTHDSSRVVVWGGFIGTSEQWASFDAAWRAKLDKPLPGRRRLRKFGLADCQGYRGEFEGYSAPESDLLQNEMRELIVQAGVIGLSFAIDRAEWDRLAPPPARERFGDAETMAFAACFEAAIDRAVRYFPSELMLSLHFDQGRKSDKLRDVIAHVRDFYKGAPAFVNISFNPVEQFTPLQAADIIATETYWQAKEILERGEIAKPRPHFAHFLQRVSTEGYILDETQIRSTLKDHGFA